MGRIPHLNNHAWVCYTMPLIKLQRTRNMEITIYETVSESVKYHVVLITFST